MTQDEQQPWAGYITLEEYHAYKRIRLEEQPTWNGNVDDDVAEELILAASDLIEVMALRRFRAVEDVEEEERFFRPDPADPELLFDADLASLTSVTNGNGQEISDDDLELLPLNGYPKYGVRLLTGRWRGKVVVTGKWTYAPATPPSIKLACYQIVNAEYSRRFGDAGESATHLTAGGVVLVPQSIPKTARDVIVALRRNSIGGG